MKKEEIKEAIDFLKIVKAGNHGSLKKTTIIKMTDKLIIFAEKALDCVPEEESVKKIGDRERTEKKRPAIVARLKGER